MNIDAATTLSGYAAGNTIAGQAITATGNTLSTNTLDLLQQHDIGQGCELFLRARVMQAFNLLTTLEIQVVTTDDAALSVNLNVLGTTGPIALASLTAGALFTASINPGGPRGEGSSILQRGQRYIGLRYIVTGTAPTAGTVFADIGEMIDDAAKINLFGVGFSIT